MQGLDRIIEFIIHHFDECDCHGGGGARLDLPDYDLMPFDFLSFAKNNLDTNSSEALINCVGHLKRAIDCQLDVFLYAIGLKDIFLKNNLKFDLKLEAIKLLGIIDSKSLSILNYKRNKMEHDYVVPDIQDIQTYYELCVAFCSVLEANIMMLSVYGSPLEWYENSHKDSFEGLQKMMAVVIDFKQEGPSIAFDMHGPERDVFTATFSPGSVESTKEYLKALNVFFILCRSDMVLSKRHAKSLLESLLKT